jgi:aromatic-L-amino-acid/L-tryptophan decarboxylase
VTGRHDEIGTSSGGLDPNDWDELRKLGHRMIDDVIDGFRTIRDGPVWQPVPAAVRQRLREPLPLEPIGADAAYEAFKRDIRPYPRGNGHPRFWGWVNGSGLPVGVLAELLAAAMNPSVSAFETSALLVEEQVLEWLKEMLDFPASTSGLLTSGCSMSTIVALAVARSAKAGFDVRRAGVAAAARPLVLYASTETHGSVSKAVELLGLGRDALRLIPVDDDFRIDVDALHTAVDADRRRGLQPLCVIANAGTVNTGAIDPLDEVADVCCAHELWMHVDGAFGALAWLCPELRQALGGLQRADSLAFDLHKWMYLPYDVGCVFVRDGQAHRNAFAASPDYLSRTAAGPSSCLTNFADHGIELTRRFRALKVWLALKAHGVGAFAEQIRRNVRQAAFLAARVTAHPELELVAPVSLNVVCFRYRAPMRSAVETDRINHDVLTRLHTSGVALPSHTTINGRFAIRAAVTNHRSEQQDFELLVDTVARLGAEMDARLPYAVLSAQVDGTHRVAAHHKEG